MNRRRVSEEKDKQDDARSLFAGWNLDDFFRYSCYLPKGITVEAMNQFLLGFAPRPLALPRRKPGHRPGKALGRLFNRLDTEEEDEQYDADDECSDCGTIFGKGGIRKNRYKGASGRRAAKRIQRRRNIYAFLEEISLSLDE